MPTQSAQWTATSRLLRRTGFGSTGPAVDAVMKQGVPAWLTAALDVDPTTDPGSVATPLPSMTAKALTREQNQTLEPKDPARATLKKQLAADRRALTGWWLRRMVGATQPFAERLTFAWHDHFATSQGKVRFPELMLNQNVTLRDLGRGDFRALGLAMLTDPAMLRWLDGQTSTVKSPNENLSREFMELFALGEGGGYTEQDIKEGARALTGWTLTPAGEVAFRPPRHDRTSKTVLGVTGNLDTEGFLDAVLARPESAQHVATRLWRHFVSPDAPESGVLADLVAAYGQGRDLRALLERMLGGEELAAAEGSHVVSPLEWTVGTIRTLRVPLEDDKEALRVAADLRALGQVPFYPPSVAGWPIGQAWLSTAATTQRIQTAQRLVAAGDISTVADAGSDDRLDAAAYLLGIGGWSDRSAAALRPLAGNPPALVTMATNTAEYLVH